MKYVIVAYVEKKGKYFLLRHKIIRLPVNVLKNKNSCVLLYFPFRELKMAPK